MLLVVACFADRPAVSQFHLFPVPFCVLTYVLLLGGFCMLFLCLFALIGTWSHQYNGTCPLRCILLKQELSRGACVIVELQVSRAWKHLLDIKHVNSHMKSSRANSQS